MTSRKDRTESFSDIEKPHETVADSFGDGLSREPMTVRLGDLWSDFVRGGDEQREKDAPPPRSPSALPLLDDMKGILQWD
jgi:hypothetical protein